MPAEPLALRRAMRFWASGVTVVSARYQELHHGMTVSSFTSLSLTPPLVMVSLENDTRTRQYVQDSCAFGVTILAEDQEQISNRFAEPKMEASYRFEGLRIHTLETGAPFLSDGLAFFDCRVVASHEAGTHTIYIGEVVAAEVGKGERPLLYFNQGYRRLD